MRADHDVASSRFYWELTANLSFAYLKSSPTNLPLRLFA